MALVVKQNNLSFPSPWCTKMPSGLASGIRHMTVLKRCASCQQIKSEITVPVYQILSETALYPVRDVKRR